MVLLSCRERKSSNKRHRNLGSSCWRHLGTWKTVQCKKHVDCFEMVEEECTKLWTNESYVRDNSTDYGLKSKTLKQYKKNKRQKSMRNRKIKNGR